jgi:outer membrane protein TolC
MVRSTIRDLYYRAEGERRQLATYRKTILPQARQSLNASMAAYQTGKTDFLMLLDSYRMLVELGMDALMHRMEFEQTVARLEREIGITELSRIR